MADKPYKIGGDAQPRTPDGRFVRPDAVPPNPLEEKKPEQWAPQVGQGSAELSQGENPWPEIPAPEGGKPMKVS